MTKADSPLIYLPDEKVTETLGRYLAEGLRALERGAVIALDGELGAGKTALARAIITALGHDGAVVSPSYTLLESYAVAGRWLHHLDLYRLADPEELEYIGLREVDTRQDWVLIEWAERGRGYLPRVDLTIVLRYAERGRMVESSAATEAGETLRRALRMKR